MKPFLLLQSRPEVLAAKDEYKSILKFGGLKPDQLSKISIDKAGVPDINLKDYSGVIVGGGPWNLSDPADEKTPAQIKAEAEIQPLLYKIIQSDFPYLGICLGMGMLVKYLGGNVSTENMEPVLAQTMQLTEAGTADPLLAHVPDSFLGFVGHHEGSKQAPKGSVLLATSKKCPVQMIRVQHNIYATQFHVELDSDDFINRITIYKNYGYFEPEELGDLIHMARQVAITAPIQILRNFISRYATM